jgi:threonine dehydrogenase-like Zn-dependent dehydrogenase
MKTVVWHGVGDIRLDDVPDPKIEQPTDAIARLIASAICGADLHFVHRPGLIVTYQAAQREPVRA